jgi:hypothetical protein
VLLDPYPSTDGSSKGCLPLTDGECLPFSELSQSGQDYSDLAVDLAEQADIYNALLLSVNERQWISGLISEGYYPPAILHDFSTSVHGKPAGGVLWYWYQMIGGE